MIKYIKKQIETNKNLNLLFRSLSDLIAIDEDFKENILELKKTMEKVPDRLINETIKSTLESIYAVNQFINVDEDGIKDLNDLYKSTYVIINKENFNTTMEKHFNKLSEIIGNYYPEECKNKLKDIEKIGSVINAQYSAEFQLGLYELSINDLNEPIIDIGCGSKAEFVKVLQSQGKDAFGIDRMLNLQTEKIIQTSWFDYHFYPESWGTIYSNMSFSNHFIYSLRNDKKQILKYLQKYRELLKSLKRDGEFIYAPSLPEIEDTINMHQYEVKRIRKTDKISITKVRRIAI